MNPATESSGPGPSTCLKCGHVFPPGTPEPIWCPDCGRLCSALDPPYQPPPPPDEYPVTPGERRRWRIWFWVLLLLGPVLTVLSMPLSRAVTRILPAALKPLLAMSGPLVLLALPVVCAIGAAFCLSRCQPVARTGVELVTFVILASVGLLLAQAILLVLGFAVALGSIR